jgi:hydroxymethylpyrimidine/phosphomethylpyrimidine kinase
MHRALTIAGSDPGGGAEIQADLKTFHRFGAYGMSAITLVTVQNTVGVEAVHLLPPDLVAAQIRAVVEDLGVDAAKTGALGSPEIIEAVGREVARLAIPKLVIDPVMISKHGAPLIAKEAIGNLKKLLLPHAALLTPNLHEVEALLGSAVHDEKEMREAARELRGLGPKAVLIKGGHLESEEAVDVLFDGEEYYRFPAERVHTQHTHGTGCTYSAAIAALLARGEPLAKAVGEAKAFMTRAIATAPGLGHGHGPVNHWA